MSEGPQRPLRIVGRCELFGEIGSGGMATVHLGRLAAAGGFAKIVAIKRMHEQLAKDPEFVAMFLDEARLVARIEHPNVRPTLDLIEEDGELFIVMEYVAGVTLRRIFFEMMDRKVHMPPAVAAHIICGVLHGLEAAHNATDSSGEPLMLVHRDVSPENILVGSDGVARLLDFGMAKALGRLHLTQPGLVKGKLTVMAPEQVKGQDVTRRTDVFATGVVLWQALTGLRLIQGEHIGEVAHNVLTQEIRPPSTVRESLSPELDAVVMKALSRDPAERFESAEAMAVALEDAVDLATRRQVADWVRDIAGVILGGRERLVAEIDRIPITPALTARRSGGYTWMAGALDSAKRAFKDARSALAEAVGREEDPRTTAKIRRVITEFPRVAIGAAVGVLFLSVFVVVIASGDETTEDTAAAADETSPSKKDRKAKPVADAAPADGSASPAPASAWIAVAAGEHMLGCNTWADRLCGPDEMPPTKVTLAGFSIMRHEVTVKQYRACVEAGACDANGLDSHGIEGVKLEAIDKCNYGREGRDDHPINCVSHAQAAAYCKHAGARLPTEAEWERVAGGSDAWPFPTGEATITCERAVMSENGDGCGRGTTWPVGSKPAGASPEGALDMSGNVREWVADYYAPNHRGVETDNPRGPAEGALRVTRGGSWRDKQARLLRSSARGTAAEGLHAIELGFRCAK